MLHEFLESTSRGKAPIRQRRWGQMLPYGYCVTCATTTDRSGRPTLVMGDSQRTFRKHQEMCAGWRVPLAWPGEDAEATSSGNGVAWEPACRLRCQEASHPVP